MRKKSQAGLASVFCYLVLAIFAFLYITPILYMIVSSFKADSRVLTDGSSILALVPVDASFQNYLDVFSRVNFTRVMFNSIFITGMIMLCGLMVNSLAGYALARLRWRGRNLVLIFVFSLMIIPFETIAVPLFSQVSLIGWRNSYHVQIIPFVADAFSI